MRGKILVVEDDGDSLLATSIQLENSGFEVLRAHNVTMALRLAYLESPDIVLFGLGQPEGDGYTIIKELQNSTASAPAPVIVITSRDAAGHQERSHEAGAFDFFQKPVPYKWLLASIEKALAETRDNSSTPPRSRFTSLRK
jgi:DNA-binding response OmpR family regulator